MNATRWPAICGARIGRGGWFRVFGYGVVLLHNADSPPVFSERYGYTKTLKIGPYRLRLLGAA